MDKTHWCIGMSILVQALAAIYAVDLYEEMRFIDCQCDQDSM